jgi:hypothetical protein
MKGQGEKTNSCLSGCGMLDLRFPPRCAAAPQRQCDSSCTRPAAFATLATSAQLPLRKIRRETPVKSRKSSVTRWCTERVQSGHPDAFRSIRGEAAPADGEAVACATQMAHVKCSFFRAFASRRAGTSTAKKLVRGVTSPISASSLRPTTRVSRVPQSFRREP